MAQIQAKQIKKIQSGVIKITGLSITSGSSSTNITSALTSALTIAGEGGTSVPLVASNTTANNGVVVTPPINKCEIWDNTTKQKIVTVTNSFEVYGRITVAGSVYTLSFYYLNGSGTETSFTFSSAATIEFDFIYRYLFHQLPADAAVAFIARNVYQDAKGANAIETVERLSVSSVNTLTNLSSIPTYPAKTLLIINGHTEDSLGGSPSFTITGNVITWNAANAGYSLETTDIVTARFWI